MGIDLRLLPIDGSFQQGDKIHAYSHTVLELGRIRYATMAPLLDATCPNRIPKTHVVSCFVAQRPDGELGYGELGQKDAYGNDYQWAPAGALVLALAAAVERDDKQEVPWLRAKPALAYLKALLPTTFVVLDWH